MTFAVQFMDGLNPVLGLNDVWVEYYDDDADVWVRVDLSDTDNNGTYNGGDPDAPWPDVTFWVAGYGDELVWPVSPTAKPTGSMVPFDDDCFMQWQVDDNRP